MTVSTLTEGNRRLETTPTNTVGRSLTIEMVLYAGIFGLALFLRLFRLDLAPLSESEAAQALAALRGDVVPIGGSPLLYGLNALLMSLFSPGDAIVRLLPALVGSFLVLAPVLFRDALGRLGALGAALILALSPVGLVASRSLGGESIVVVCSLALVVFIRRYASDRNERHLYGVAVALGIGLTAGPGMYTALLAMGIGLLVLRIALGHESGMDWGALRRSIGEAPGRPRVAAVFVGTFILAATTVLTQPVGLGAAGDILAAWLNAFGSGGGSQAFDIVQVLIVYETFALAAGSFGLARVMLGYWRVSPASSADTGDTELLDDLEQSDGPSVPGQPSVSIFAPWLGFTAIISLVIVVMQWGRQPTDLLLPVTLLALLAAYVIQPWIESLIANAHVGIDGVILAVGVAVSAFLILTLTSYVRGRILPILFVGAIVPDEFTTLAMFVLVLGLVGALLVMMYDLRSVLRSAVTLALLLLTLSSFSAGWGATQVRVGDAHEIILGPRVTTPGVRLLLDTIEQIAIRAQGHLGTLPIRVEMDDPVIDWYLRDARIPPGDTAAGVITRYGEHPPSGGEGYVGARFNIQETWDAVGLSSEAWMEWALFRQSPDLPSLDALSVTVWERH